MASADNIFFRGYYLQYANHGGKSWFDYWKDGGKIDSKGIDVCFTEIYEKYHSVTDESEAEMISDTAHHLVSYRPDFFGYIFATRDLDDIIEVLDILVLKKLSNRKECLVKIGQPKNFDQFRAFFTLNLASLGGEGTRVAMHMQNYLEGIYDYNEIKSKQMSVEKMKQGIYNANEVEVINVPPEKILEFWARKLRNILADYSDDVYKNILHNCMTYFKYLKLEDIPQDQMLRLLLLLP